MRAWQSNTVSACRAVQHCQCVHGSATLSVHEGQCNTVCMSVWHIVSACIAEHAWKCTTVNSAFLSLPFSVSMISWFPAGKLGNDACSASKSQSHVSDELARQVTTMYAQQPCTFNINSLQQHSRAVHCNLLGVINCWHVRCCSWQLTSAQCVHASNVFARFQAVLVVCVTLSRWTSPPDLRQYL